MLRSALIKENDRPFYPFAIQKVLYLLRNAEVVHGMDSQDQRKNKNGDKPN